MKMYLPSKVLYLGMLGLRWMCMHIYVHELDQKDYWYPRKELEKLWMPPVYITLNGAVVLIVISHILSLEISIQRPATNTTFS